MSSGPFSGLEREGRVAAWSVKLSIPGRDDSLTLGVRENLQRPMTDRQARPAELSDKTRLVTGVPKLINHLSIWVSPRETLLGQSISYPRTS